MNRIIVTIAASACTALMIGALPASADSTQASGFPANPEESRLTERTALTGIASAIDDTVPDPKTPITFIADLPGDSTALTRAARVASTPGRPGYRQFLTLKAAGKTFGPSKSQIRQLRSVTSNLGIDVEIDNTGVFARFTAPVETWETIYGQSINVLWHSPAFPFDLFAFVNSRDFLLSTPPSLTSVVENLIPYYQVYVPPQGPTESATIHPRGIWPIDDTLPWPLNTGAPLGTTCDDSAIAERRVFTPTQTRDVYGLSRLPGGSASGSTARVAVITQSEGYDPSQITRYTECFGLDSVSIREVRGMGVTRSFANLPGPDSETLLDLMTVIGALGTATEVTLVTEWADSIAGISFLDGFARALDSYGDGTTVPDAVTLSYAGCELAWTGSDYLVQEGIDGLPTRTMIDEVLALAAVVGTSVLSSTGDAGSFMCASDPTASGTITEPTIGYPASSPWITAVGGTRLALGSGNRRTSEVVWNDAVYGELGAGTGGPSSFYGRPWYQKQVNLRGPRTVPDLSALASPYWPVFIDDKLTPVGGTSASTPFLAAAFAMLSAQERLAGRPPLGFLNPWLYSLPARAYFDVRHGDNQLAIPTLDGRINTPACCQATPGFDMASGLGAPKLLRMSQDIAPPVPAR